MKNVIKLFKSILSSNVGKVSSSVIAGLTTGAFAVVIGYGVYSSYHNTPTYTPGNHSSYMSEGQNLNVNSFEGNRLDFQTPETLPGATYGKNGVFRSQDGFTDSSTIKGNAAKEQANFEAARAYLDSQRQGANQAVSDYGAVSDSAVGTSAFSNGDVYDPFGSTYEEGVSGMVEPGSRVGGSGNGAQQFQAAQQAAAGVAGKNAKDKSGKGVSTPDGKTARQATQIGKLASSKDGSSFAANAGGARGGNTASLGGSTGAMGGKDGNSRALPQTNAGQTGTAKADAQTFKFGRAGNVGGQNVGFKGSESKGGQNRGKGAAADMQVALAYSSKAGASNQDVGQKSLAEAAFDGSNPENVAPTIPENATIGQVSGALLNSGGLPKQLKKNFEDLEKDFEEIQKKTEELSKLQKKFNTLKWATLIGSLVISIAISFLKNIPVAGWWIAGAVAAIGIALVTGMGLWMNSIFKEMADPKFKEVNQGLNFRDLYNTVLRIPILSGVLILAGLTDMWKNTWNSITSVFKGKAATGAAAKGTAAAAGESSSGIVNAITNFSKNLTLKGFAAFRTLLEGIFPSRRG